MITTSSHEPVPLPAIFNFLFSELIQLFYKATGLAIAPTWHGSENGPSPVALAPSSDSSHIVRFIAHRPIHRPSPAGSRNSPGEGDLESCFYPEFAPSLIFCVFFLNIYVEYRSSSSSYISNPLPHSQQQPHR